MIQALAGNDDLDDLDFDDVTYKASFKMLTDLITAKYSPESSADGIDLDSPYQSAYEKNKRPIVVKPSVTIE